LIFDFQKTARKSPGNLQRRGKSMSKIRLLVGTLAGMMLLSGCSPVIESSKSSTVETATFPNSTAAVTSTVEALITPTDIATATEAIENIEGVSTQEQIQSNISNYLSGKVDYSLTGPNKDYLFVDKSGNKVDFSKIFVSGDMFDSCKQGGVYLGSISNVEGRVISFWGTQKTNGQAIVEVFTSGFLNKPDYLPINMGIGYLVEPEKDPDWIPTSAGTYGDIKTALNFLSGRENHILSWSYICGQTPEGTSKFLSGANETVDQRTLLLWALNASKANTDLFTWLKGLSSVSPDNVFFGNKKLDFSKLDWENIPPVTSLVIPTSNN
jgi:hypothetical protein